MGNFFDIAKTVNNVRVNKKELTIQDKRNIAKPHVQVKGNDLYAWVKYGVFILEVNEQGDKKYVVPADQFTEDQARVAIQERIDDGTFDTNIERAFQKTREIAANRKK
ncbi:hypothetical protein [Endozoicomonas sp. SCSIO W0465]|uniref:hypothetical protein n=1 Tax=Endozoicomonas sp. SCSIO W0465 TaxID=2918516 RepID=UPI0020764604|nr:hypothetical protein [Endozoicomonas sp. SCSIO W0465]USE39534.1 hypothetical protein MJO57_16030 [Endozoicomonas sp. SCSIO W0465]